MTTSNPTREYYTVQEISDLLLEVGAHPTIVNDDDGNVHVELARDDSTLQLDFGRPREFYVDLLCRSWLFVPTAPHRACDSWNEFPYFGTFSVVYDESDTPTKTEAGFAIRGVLHLEFKRFRSEQELVLQILEFWFGLHVIQESVIAGSTDLLTIERMTVFEEVSRWWLGEE